MGLAGFELWKAWGDAAPSLAELRSATAADTDVHQQLLDAEMTVGSLAAIVGIAMWYLTGDPTVLLLLGVTVAALAYWYNGFIQG